MTDIDQDADTRISPIKPPRIERRGMAIETMKDVETYLLSFDDFLQRWEKSQETFANSVHAEIEKLRTASRNLESATGRTAQIEQNLKLLEERQRRENEDFRREMFKRNSRILGLLGDVSDQIEDLLRRMPRDPSQPSEEN